MIAVTVHFNTVELTTCLCGSLRKFHPDCKIIVFDNSTIHPLPILVREKFNIEYYDNTKEQLINFDEQFRNTRVRIDEHIKSVNNLASARHALTIDWMIKHLPYDDIILFDSDVLLKRPIDFGDCKYVTAGALSYAEHKEKSVRKLRLLPYCQFFNLKLIRAYGINYFAPDRIIGFDPVKTRGYDTGTSFYEDVLKLPTGSCKFIDSLDNYIIHFRGGSWSSDKKISDYEWLFRHRNLFNEPPNDLLPTVMNKKERAIISLTSWKARIHSVGFTIYSLLEKCPGYHIVLCLSVKEFPNKSADLPRDLQMLYQFGLFEIIWCDADIKPHKKYFYTMLKYRNVPIITVDDDQIPTVNIADILFQSYLTYPNAVHAGRCHEIKYDQNGITLPYDSWRRCQTKLLRPSYDLFATGCGGVLYPPNILQLSENQLDTITDIITADDIYLKFRENELNIKVKYVPGCTFIDVGAPQGLALQNNLGAHLNDKYIKKYLTMRHK